ncbi:MAG: dUTP diphosphatase [Patescibacteria group bacterium]|nr:dUTP diphosphatase [Patescibacteria group bacterium]
MKITIKRFDQNLPLPQYKTSGAAALDLATRVEMKIPAHQTKLVPLNFALKLPQDYFALISVRSSLHRKGLMMANGVGIGDEDYCGDGDEYRAALHNLTDQPVVVERGERIAQLIILKRDRIEWQEVDQLSSKNRGGFGSTGRK